MSEKNSRTERQRRKRTFETFEERIVMTANGLTEAAFDSVIEVPEIVQQVEVREQSSDINDLFGVNAVREQYQFDGTGQTVAVIDSGIAFDHLALGGGFGEDYRVVGGYDFADNDSNPFDSGSAGFHGTHVTGIIGSDDDTHQGVSPGVDLVGLRVFDDNGAGNFSWIEDALQWVHENKDAFENPITTVNLSLGADFNGDTVPEWATLEDEFLQLKNDGIFIAVAAGNSFDSYNEAGLAYPAVSEHVVPVSSHDIDGNISDFSQRNQRVLVAPGERVTSTAPGHLNVGPDDNSFIAASGTSQASPFVAGASTLLRQANEFVGIENIDQDLLYQQFVDSADEIYDSVTGAYYNRLNLQAAIDSVISDIHSDHWASATDGGNFEGGELITGTVGQIDDVDKFVFTANRTGEITLNLTTTHELRAAVNVVGADATVVGNQVKFNVLAGEEYRFSVGTSDGIGHYEVDVELTESNIQGTNWGVIHSNTFSENISAGENWYQLSAARDGLLSLSAHVPDSGNVQFELFDTNMNRIGTANSEGDFTRITANVNAGQSVVLKVTSATDNNFNIHASNQLSIQDNQLTVLGTTGDDHVAVNVGDSINVNINGVNHEFSSSEISQIRVAGLAGSDTFETNIDQNVNHAFTRGGTTRIATDEITITGNGLESISIDAVSGDSIHFYDTAGNDTLSNEHGEVTLVGGGLEAAATGFNKVFAYASGGHDIAHLFGTAGDDLFTTTEELSVLKNTNQEFIVRGYEGLAVSGQGGNDNANLFDSSGNDEFIVQPNFSNLKAAGYQIWVGGFNSVTAHSTAGGFDSIQLFDSAGDDFFRQKDGQSILTGEGYLSVANGFEWVRAYGSTGNDVAQIFDTAGNDTLHASTNHTRLESGVEVYSVNDFDHVTAVASRGGFDRAFIRGTSGTDFVSASEANVSVFDAFQKSNVAIGFSEVTVDTLGGEDFTSLVGSERRDILQALETGISFETTLQLLQLVNSENINFDGNGGVDEVLLGGFDQLDLLEAVGDKATAYLNNQRIEATDFSFLEAQTADGANSTHDIDAVDFLFLLDGNWQAAE